MGRAEKRRQGRQQDRIEQELRRQILHKTQRQLNDGRVEAMMVCMTLGLHREFEFDHDDCMRALRAVDDLMNPWVCGECDLEDMRQQVRDQIGIEIKC